MLLSMMMLAATSPVPAIHRPAARCTRPDAEKVGAAQAPRVLKLGEMPPAEQMLAVLREVDGCPRPVVLRDDVGALRR